MDPFEATALTRTLLVGDVSASRRCCARVLGRALFGDPDGHLFEISGPA